MARLEISSVSPVGREERIDANFVELYTTVFAASANYAATVSAAAVSTSHVRFPASQSASTDANTLDDYEEGTWTPVLTFATPGDVSVTYSEQIGDYVKIGKLVLATFNITTSAFTHTTASGLCNVTGLPFQAGGTSPMRMMSGLNWAGITKANYTDICARVDSGNSLVVLGASGSGQAISTVSAADMPTGGTVVLRGTVTYIASA